MLCIGERQTKFTENLTGGVISQQVLYRVVGSLGKDKK